MTAKSPTTRIPELCKLNAIPLGKMLRERKVSAVDVAKTYLDHIEAVNPQVNALVSMRPRTDILADAQAADDKLAGGEAVGPLHGIPQAIKDLALTKGLRTTFGSPLFSSLIPDQDSIYVDRMKAAGAIVIGKTNVPEFGYGSNSYNPIFGLTRNAYDFDRIGGGSSGGAGVALAMRMLPVADGSDMGGSLRNPAAYNNVFGFRPSQGRIPADAFDPFYEQLGIEGPMGRSVADIAMLLGVQAGYDPRAPLSLDTAVDEFAAITPAAPKTLRFGWLGDYDGHLAMEPGVLELTEQAARLFASAGATVETVHPGFDMESLWQAFVTLRQHLIGGRHSDAYADPEQRKLLKPEAIWEIEHGHRHTSLDVYRAGLVRGAWYKAMLRLFERFDFLLLPTAQVFPFAADCHWPAEVNGRTMDSYHRWMEVVAGPTMAGCPSISVPAGFNADGLPMGLQIIGRPRGDAAVLRAAALYESLCPWIDRLPPSLS